MSFREYCLKKLIPTYFMIVTFIIISMAVVGIIFFGNINISLITLFIPPLFGAIGCLPLLVDFLFLKVKGSGLWLLLYHAAELVMLEACILTAAYFLRMIDTVFTASSGSVCICRTKNSATVSMTPSQSNLQTTGNKISESLDNRAAVSGDNCFPLRQP